MNLKITTIVKCSATLLLIGIFNLPVRSQNKSTANDKTNTILGYNSGNRGASNTSIGYEAGSKVVSAANTFIGSGAGRETTFGSGNVFVGSGSGELNSMGAENVIIGSKAGYNSYDSKFNVLVGSYAGHHLVSGEENVFIGNQSGFKNNFGKNNTFLGSSSGSSNKTGNSNTFLGFYTGLANQTGDGNVFIGYRAGSINVSGKHNTFIGYNAGNSILTGSNNLFIGPSASPAEDVDNQFLIHNHYVNAVPLLSGNFSSGNISIGNYYNYGYRLFVDGNAYATGIWISNQYGFSNASKNNSNSVGNMLHKIVSLESNITATGTKSNDVGYELNPYILAEAFPSLVKIQKEHTAVNYQGLIPILVEAIKELKKQNENLERKLATLISDSNDGEFDLHGYFLSQNVPNPTTGFSVIAYALPVRSEDCRIKIFDAKGTSVMEFSNLKKGNQQIQIEKGSLSSGMYTYSLLVGNKTISSRKMIVK